MTKKMSDSMADGRGDSNIVQRIRRIVIAIFLFGLLGSGTELLLIGHTEDLWQWVPLILSGLSLIALAAFFVAKRTATLNLLRLMMYLFIASGLTGTYLHYKGNVEFELEMYPAMTGLELFWEAIQGATPVLAPGTMIVLGLVGLVFTYKYTRLEKGEQKQGTEE